nr:MAG TPA: hypothetical protein [Caudoviricetes sp.]DAX41543.1 MAG TPA: hypothetical protein [Caudoviricetes sp.]
MCINKRSYIDSSDEDVIDPLIHLLWVYQGYMPFMPSRLV